MFNSNIDLNILYPQEKQEGLTCRFYLGENDLAYSSK